MSKGKLRSKSPSKAKPEPKPEAKPEERPAAAGRAEREAENLMADLQHEWAADGGGLEDEDPADLEPSDEYPRRRRRYSRRHQVSCFYCGSEAVEEVAGEPLCEECAAEMEGGDVEDQWWGEPA